MKHDRGKIVVALILLVIIVPSTIINGWVISVLWGWFVTSVFAGAPRLGIAQAVGLSLVARTMTWHPPNTTDDRSYWYKVGSAVGAAVVAPVLVLSVGWIVKGFL
jgi:hypothetical protein